MARRIGIDLGHTNCRMAWWNGGGPQILANGDNERYTPSLLAVHTDGQILSGRGATGWAALHPERVIPDAVARMVAGERVTINGFSADAGDLVAHLVRRLKADAEKRIGEEVSSAFVAAPPGWSVEARLRFSQASQRANLPIVLFESALAAALAAGCRQPADRLRRVLVFDLGGVLCSVTLLSWHEGRLRVSKTASLPGVAGSAFDQQIVDYVSVLIEQQHQVKPVSNPRFMADLRKQAEQAKIALGGHRYADVVIMGGLRTPSGAPVDVEVELSREDFERMIEDKVAAITALGCKVLDRAGLGAEQIDSVILAGGSTCVPCVRRAVEAVFGSAKIIRDTDPLEGIAMGAAWMTGDLGVEVHPFEGIDIVEVAALPAASWVGTEDDIPTNPPAEPQPQPVSEVPPVTPAEPQPQPVSEVPPVTPAEPQPQPVSEVPPVTPAEPQPQPVSEVPPVTPAEPQPVSEVPPVTPAEPQPQPVSEVPPVTPAELQPQPVSGVPPVTPAEPQPQPVSKVPPVTPEPQPQPVSEVPSETPAEPQPQPVSEVPSETPAEPQPQPVSEVPPETPTEPQPVSAAPPETPAELQPQPVSEVPPEGPAEPQPVGEQPAETLAEPAPAAGSEEPPASEKPEMEGLQLVWEDVREVRIRRRFGARAFVRIGSASVWQLATPAEGEGPCLSRSFFYLDAPVPLSLDFVLILKKANEDELRACLSAPLSPRLAAGARIDISLEVDYESGHPFLTLSWLEPEQGEPVTVVCRDWTPWQEPVSAPPPAEEEAAPPPETMEAVAATELEPPAVPPEPPAEPRERCGPYEIIESVEQGRYSETFVGADKVSGDRVLITSFSPQDERAKNAFLGSLLPLSIHHPNIVEVRHFGSTERGYYVATEQFGTKTLRSLLGSGMERQPASTEKVLVLIAQVCEGLQTLHDHHIFHRNLKPANVLIDAEDRVAKIADFQVAVSLRGRDRVTQVSGTLPYMAKEVLEGSADHRADIYAVGVMLYELLTGKLPFWSTSQRTLVDQITNQAAPEPRLLNPRIPEHLSDAILRALEKDPQRRFQTASELRDGLAQRPESWYQTITSGVRQL